MSKSDGAIEVIARAFIVSGNAVLLCRNRKHGHAYLPGGHVEFGETAAAACARELEEECDLPGVTVGPPLLVQEHIFTQKGKPRHEVNVMFHVEHSLQPPTGPDAAPPAVASRESEIAFIWADPRTLTTIDLRPDTVRSWLIARLRAVESHRLDWMSSPTDTV